MIPDDVGQQLHDKATRGGVLTPEERTLLEAWYARHDVEEAQLLARAEPSRDLDELRSQVAAGAARLVTLTQRLQALLQENERLRREVEALQRQLALKQAKQAV
jgi:hypothetical protein